MIHSVALILKYTSILCLLIIVIGFSLFKLFSTIDIEDNLKDKLCSLSLYITFIAAGLLSVCLLSFGFTSIIDWVQGIL